MESTSTTDSTREIMGLCTYGHIRKHFFASLSPWTGSAADEKYQKNIMSILKRGIRASKRHMVAVTVLPEEYWTDAAKFDALTPTTLPGKVWMADGNKRLMMFSACKNEHPFLMPELHGDETVSDLNPETWAATELHRELQSVVSAALTNALDSLCRGEIASYNNSLDRKATNVEPVTWPVDDDQSKKESLRQHWLDHLTFRVPKDDETTNITIIAVKSKEDAQYECQRILLDNNTESVSTGLSAFSDDLLWSAATSEAQKILENWELPYANLWKRQLWPTAAGLGRRETARVSEPENVKAPAAFDVFCGNVLQSAGLIYFAADENHNAVEMSFWEPSSSLNVAEAPTYLRTIVKWIVAPMLLQKLRSLCEKAIVLGETSSSSGTAYSPAKWVVKFADVIGHTTSDVNVILTIIEELLGDFSLEKIKAAFVCRDLFHQNAMKLGTPVWKAFSWSFHNNFAERKAVLLRTLSGQFYRGSLNWSKPLKSLLKTFQDYDLELARQEQDALKAITRGTKRKSTRTTESSSTKKAKPKPKKASTAQSTAPPSTAAKDPLSSTIKETKAILDAGLHKSEPLMDEAEAAVLRHFVDILGTWSPKPRVNLQKLITLCETFLRSGIMRRQPSVELGRTFSDVQEDMKTRRSTSSKTRASRKAQPSKPSSLLSRYVEAIEDGFCTSSSAFIDVSHPGDSKGPHRLVASVDIQAGHLIGVYGVADGFKRSKAPLRSNVKYEEVRRGPNDNTRVKLPPIHAETAQGEAMDAPGYWLTHEDGPRFGGPMAAINHGCGPASNCCFVVLDLGEGEQDDPKFIFADEMIEFLALGARSNEKGELAEALGHRIRILVVATRDVGAEEELLVDYTGGNNRESALWFVCSCGACEKRVLANSAPSGLILSTQPAFQVMHPDTAAGFLTASVDGRGLTREQIEELREQFPAILMLAGDLPMLRKHCAPSLDRLRSIYPIGQAPNVDRESEEWKLHLGAEAYKPASRAWIAAAQQDAAQQDSASEDVMTARVELSTCKTMGEYLQRILTPSMSAELAEYFVASQAEALTLTPRPPIVTSSTGRISSRSKSQLGEIDFDVYGLALDNVLLPCFSIMVQALESNGVQLLDVVSQPPVALSSVSPSHYALACKEDPDHDVQGYYFSLKEAAKVLHDAEEEYASAEDTGGDPKAVRRGRAAIEELLEKKKQQAHQRFTSFINAA